MKVRIDDARLAFAKGLWKAESVQGEGTPAFSSTFLIVPTHPVVKVLNAAFETIAKEKWGDKAPAILKAMRAGDKVALHNGDTKSQYEGFEGMLFVSSRSKVRPSVFDGLKNPLTEADGKPYSGCYVNAVIELWAQDNSYGKRINAQLKGVQFLRDGDAFTGGGTAATEDDFDEVQKPAEDPLAS